MEKDKRGRERKGGGREKYTAQEKQFKNSILNLYLYFLVSILMEAFLETSRSWAVMWGSSQKCQVDMADGSLYCTPLPGQLPGWPFHVPWEGQAPAYSPSL